LKLDCKSLVFITGHQQKRLLSFHEAAVVVIVVHDDDVVVVVTVVLSLRIASFKTSIRAWNKII
jgi:hypothetical protein